MIKLRNIHKSFGDLKVLKGLSMDIEQGEVVTIIGPSGSGKSTLLRCINFLERPDQGSISFDENHFSLKELNEKDLLELRSYSSMVFQNYNLFRHRTVLENITDPLILVKGKSKEEAKEIALELLRTVGLEEKAPSYPRQLSGGQQQRIGIARAMSIQPYLMLFDEPTSSLDPELVKEVLYVINDLAKKKQTMMIVTHEMQFAKLVSDRVVFIDHGNIVEEGRPDQMFNQPRTKRLQDFLDIINIEKL